jgi:hypothetical protein
VGTTELGLIEQLVPTGAPEHVSWTGSVNPFCVATVRVTLADLPTLIVTDEADAPSEKDGGTAGLTTSDPAVLAFTIPSVPTTLKL